METRGVRNNNPGNIRHSRAQWQGMVPRGPTSDKSFVTFTEPRYGVRAIVVTLVTYFDKRLAEDGSPIDTVDEVVARWAPPNENDTSAYANYVGSKHPKGRYGKLDLHTYADMRPLVEAIIAFENNGHKYPKAIIDAGMRLAGIEPTKVSPAKTAEGAGAMVGGSGVGGQFLLDAATQLQVVGTDTSSTLRWVFVGLMLAGVTISVIGMIRRWKLQGVA